MIQGKKLTEFEHSIQQLQFNLVSRCLLALLALITLRYTHVLVNGWQKADSVLLGLSLLGLVLWLMRYKIPQLQLAASLILLMCLTAALNMMQFGMNSSGLPVFIAACFLCALLFNIQITLIISLIVVLAAIFTGFVYLNNPLNSFSEQHQEFNYIIWTATVIGSLLFIPFISDHLFSLAQSRSKEQEKFRQMNSQLPSKQYDPLTGLAVLDIFMDRLKHELNRNRRNNSLGAVLFIDIDNFSAINEQYGNEAANVVLRTLSARISSIVRAADTLCRIGGDEFIAIFADQKEEDNVRLIARKLLATVNNPIVFSDDSIDLEVSIGVALFPTHSVKPQELVSIAQQAVRLAKDSGGNTYRVASAEL